MSTVIKRDGTKVPFDITKVEKAISAAFEAQGHSPEDYREALNSTCSQVVAEAEFYQEIEVEHIQDIIEVSLSSYDFQVAKAFITYRYEHAMARDKHQAFIREIGSLLKGANKEVNSENANKDSKVFNVKRDLLAGLVSKFIAKETLPADVLAAHEAGLIHYHDMDYSPALPMTNCCLADIGSMLTYGFRLGNADIESPKSFSVACAVVAQIIAQVASGQYGGTTFANVDVVLADFADASYGKWLKIALHAKVFNPVDFALERTKKEIYDGIQALEYECNTLFSSNGQTPFITFTFGTGRTMFSRWIQEAILKVRMKGLGSNGITAVFPKLVMFLGDNLNMKEGDINYDLKQLALECSAKRLYPDYISISNNKDITGSSVPVSPMGCRSFLSVWENEEGKEVLDGRNNLGVVSLNLPRIALDAKGDTVRFLQLLDERLLLCKKALYARLDSFKGVKAEVAPVLYTEGGFGERLKHDEPILNLLSKKHRSSISLGYIGLHEVGLILFGVHPFDSKEAQVFLKKVAQRLRDAVDEWKAESDYGFSLYATPAESLCYRFCRLDTAKYGLIEGVTDKGYYTNSFHLDVEKKVSPFDKIDYECDYHWISSGGHISFVELPNMQKNLKALEAIIDYAMSKLDYFGLNTPSDQCFGCGYEGEFLPGVDGFTCPKCGNHESTKMSVIRRVCGYLSSPDARPFNEGKQKEVIRRIKHVKEC